MPFYKVFRTTSTGTKQSKTFYALDEAAAHALADAEDDVTDEWVDETEPPAIPLSKDTLQLLKHLATITNVMTLQEGHIQKVVNKAESLLAVAILPDAWPKTVPIAVGDLVKALSVFKTPVIGCTADDGVMITDAHDPSQRAKIPYYQNLSTWDDPIADPNKPLLPHDHPAIELTMPAPVLKFLQKTATRVGAPLVIAIESAAVTIHASQLVSAELSPADVVRHDSAFTRSMRLFSKDFGLLLPGDYTVVLGTWSLVVFTHQTLPLTYFMHCD